MLETKESVYFSRSLGGEYMDREPRMYSDSLFCFAACNFSLAGLVSRRGCGRGQTGSSIRFKRPGDGAIPGANPAEYHPGVAARKALLSRLGRLAPETGTNEAGGNISCEPGGTANELFAPGADRAPGVCFFGDVRMWLSAGCPRAAHGNVYEFQ